MIRWRSVAMVMLATLAGPTALAQDLGGLQIPEVEELPPALPEDKPFLEAKSVSSKLDMHDGFRIFADGRYEIYGDKVFHRLPDGSVKWTPIELGWHEYKTLSPEAVLQIAYATRDSGILTVDEEEGEEEHSKPKPPPTEETEEEQAAKPVWSWMVRIDGVEKEVVIIDYPKTRAPEAEHLYRQVQSIAFDSQAAAQKPSTSE